MSKSVLVIGGGVIGLCVAYYAMKAGHHVTLLERGGPKRDGCSFGNAGMIVPSHMVPLAAPGMVGLGLRMMAKPESPFYFQPSLRPDTLRWAWQFHRSATVNHVARSAPLLRDLHLESRRLYGQVARELDDFGYAELGILQLCATEEALHEESEAGNRARDLGISAETLTPEACAKLEPGLRLTVAGGVYYPQDAHLSPERLVAALERALVAGGVQFLWSQEVSGFRAGKGKIEAVRTRQGEIGADAYVLAAGSWSSHLARDLGLKLPLMAGRGYSVTLPQPPVSLFVPALLIEARVAVTPMGTSLRFGGTMEIVAPDTPPNPARVRGILRSIPRYFPDFEPELFRDLPAWNGLRPLSPDGLPYLGPFTQYGNLFAATGHAMMGVSLGLVTGKLMAEMLSEEAPSLDIGMLSPDRFA